MRLAQSIPLKGFVTLIAIGGFVSLYEVTIPDSKFSMLPLALERLFDPSAPPAPGARIAFSATAYCKGLVTSSGVAVQKGVMAADPTLLPVGSVIDFSVNDPKYDGIYSILDTGPEIHGREVDVYMWSCYEALRFGRKSAHITVLRLGWNPAATTSSLIDRIFRRTEEKDKELLPSRPLPVAPGGEDSRP
jgi:3D (Asp-Asp-Asp) domain-containing protein